MRLNPIEVSRRIDATTDAWLLSCWRLEKNELFVTLVLVYQTVYPPYSMSRYSFAVLFLMSNYSDRNKKKVFLGGSRE